jgi:hypothetical protein
LENGSKVTLIFRKSLSGLPLPVFFRIKPARKGGSLVEAALPGETKKKEGLKDRSLFQLKLARPLLPGVFPCLPFSIIKKA